MSAHNIDKIFDPRNIAIIDAGNGKDCISGVIEGNLIAGGFPGKVFSVNPECKKVLDGKTYKEFPKSESVYS